MTTPNVGEDAEELDDSHVAGGDVKWCSHSGKQFLIKLNLQVPYDPASAIPGVYPREMKTYVHTKSWT